jgi:hypothetical protein
VTLLLAALLAGKALVAPPPTLNIVHQRVKREVVQSYQTLEASIVSAYDRAKMPLYWMTFQSATDARDILYFNVFNTPDDLRRATSTYKSLAPSHPELGRLATRLAAMLDSETSMLTTLRDEVAYTRTDVDFSTLRGVKIATFRVKAGHEGQFVDALRMAGGSGAPWIVYESTADPTFVLVWPLRSKSDAKAAAIPRALRDLRRAYHRTETATYLLSASMSRMPVEYFAKARGAAKTKAH